MDDGSRRTTGLAAALEDDGADLPAAVAELSGISKMGQRDLRRPLVSGAMTVVAHAIRRSEVSGRRRASYSRTLAPNSRWVRDLASAHRSH